MSSVRPAPGRARRRSTPHWAGAVVDGCDPGGPSPYTRGARGRRHRARRGSTTPRTSTRHAPPDRLAVTKALTAIAPDHPELAAARAAGIPIEPWQQVIADAALGRTLVGGRPGRTARARPRAGSSTSSSPAGADPVGVRRRAAAGGPHRRRAGDRPAGHGSGLRRRGRRVRGQLRRLPAGDLPSSHRRVGPPGRLRRPGSGDRRVRGAGSARAHAAIGRPPIAHRERRPTIERRASSWQRLRA